MTNRLLDVLDELTKEEQAKKKKPSISLVKEKRLQYYSGWHKDDKAVTQEVKKEKQTKLFN